MNASFISAQTSVVNVHGTLLEYFHSVENSGDSQSGMDLAQQW